jgi:nitrile hydratase accessory protein
MPSSDALASLPGLPRAESEPIFSAPWEAQAFALVIELHARGAFTWERWTRTLADELQAQAPDDGSHYYEHWLSALERLVNELGLADAEALAARKHAWSEAYRNTPHGHSVLAPNEGEFPRGKLRAAQQAV